MSGKAKPATRSENRLPLGQHVTSGFPVLDLGIRPDISLEKWRLEVSGLVEHPKTFTWGEFNALPRFEGVSDFHCVTTWSKFDCRWSGVAFFTLAEIVKPKPEVRHVLFTSYDGYSTNVGSKIAWTTTFSSPHSLMGSPFRRALNRVRIRGPARFLGTAWLQQYRRSVDRGPLFLSGTVGG